MWPAKGRAGGKEQNKRKDRKKRGDKTEKFPELLAPVFENDDEY